tara:strand:+ start:1408 stop:2385 length:978 start_codon:yes stop_codon:yes gene_type:complete
MNNQYIEELKQLSTSQQDFMDKKLSFETFGHHFNYNVAVTIANTYTISFRNKSSKPSLNADAMAGIVRRFVDSNGVKICGYIRVIELTDQTCTLGTKRRDELDFPDLPEHTYTFDINEAKKRGLLSHNSFKTMPKNMMHKRCLTALLRAFYPDIIGVAFSTDELAEVLITDPEERDAIVYAEAAGERYRSKSSNPPPAPPAKYRPDPAPIVFKSIGKNVFSFKWKDLNTGEKAVLSSEIDRLLFNVQLHSDKEKHCLIALDKFKNKAFHSTIFRFKDLINKHGESWLNKDRLNAIQDYIVDSCYDVNHDDWRLIDLFEDYTLEAV